MVVPISIRAIAGIIAEHLAQALLIEALRLHLAEHSHHSRGWLFALADGRIRAVITAMHAEPGRNAGTANHNANETIAEIATDEFVRVMLTNALGVMRTVEGFQDRVPPSGLIGVMSSGQGSIANNTKGGFEVYRGSKAALNQYMRSYAARHADDPRAMVLMAPGWKRTALGGPHAPFSVAETIPQVVDTLVAQLGTPGLRFIDRHGDTVPW